MNISQALKINILILANSDIPNPHLDAELLLSFILNRSREYLFAYPEKILTERQVGKFSRLTNKRVKGFPIAYLLGHKFFYGLEFIVSKNVLIPRPETEMMVDEVLSYVTQRATHGIYKLSIIDVGTGSGCIIISLVKKLSFGYQKLSFYATDISKQALTIARKNAKKHKVSKKIKFLHGNLLEPIINSKVITRGANVIITANLPYLTLGQVKNSPTIKYEPKLALAAGPDGLKYYRKLFKQIKKLPADDCRLTILCEIDQGQMNKIKQLIKKEFPGAKMEFKKDLAGRNRIIIIKI